jgi:hypothetical protein
MVETRIAPRHRINKPGIAVYGGDKYPCTVRDLSLTGAAIEFPDHESVIPIAIGFTLVMPDDQLKLACRVVWRRNYMMGVAFD